MLSTHPDQGWSLLCNGVILFEDTGEILPTGGTVEPRRFLPTHPPVPAARSSAPVPSGAAPSVPVASVPAASAAAAPVAVPGPRQR